MDPNLVFSDIIIGNIDKKWRDHLSTLDYLRQSIHLKGYGQRDPKNEYKIEAFNIFNKMLESIKLDFADIMINFEVEIQKEVEQEGPKVIDPISLGNNINKNSLCPCNSGLKYKHCHGKIKA